MLREDKFNPLNKVKLEHLSGTLSPRPVSTRFRSLCDHLKTHTRKKKSAPVSLSAVLLYIEKQEDGSGHFVPTRDGKLGSRRGIHVITMHKHDDAFLTRLLHRFVIKISHKLLDEFKNL